MGNRNQTFARPAPPKPSTPPGYTAHPSQLDGEIVWYFVNDATGESSWTLPGDNSPHPSQPPPRPGASSSTPTTGWERRQQEFVKKYYNKVQTGPGPNRYQDDPRYRDF